MKLLIVTDAWLPQVNGVVKTLTQMQTALTQRGWDVKVLGPSGATLSCPTYPEIRLTLQPKQVIKKAIAASRPDFVHIATEGPLGLAMRAHCLRKKWNFTTSFHTRFPEYLKARFGVPRRLTYAYLRRFHNHATRVLVPSPSIQRELTARGIERVKVWGRGVDCDLFHPSKREKLPFKGPIFLHVGRLAVEKNIGAFLSASLPGTKLVVGDGPARQSLQAAHPDAVFVGPKFGADLARIYASSDVFVFPSLTDTFGLVNLEALASGLPVAAFPAPGPVDILSESNAGCMHQSLAIAALEALKLNREDCRAHALKYSWSRSAELFESTLVPRIKRRHEESLDGSLVASLPAFN